MARTPVARRTATAVTAGVAGAGLLAGGLAGATGAAAATASWKNTATPSPVTTGSLTQIAAGSGGAAWAVGTEGSKTALLRWTGTRWQRTSSPAVFAPTGIAVAGPKNAWTGGIGLLTPVALHWNGNSWAKVGYPATGFPMTFAASTDGGAWSIAGLARSGGGPSALLRWTGKAWAAVSLPVPPSTTITAIGARTKSDVWVGGTTTNGVTVTAIVLHYNGTSWKRTSAPAGSWGSPAYQNLLQGIDAASATSVWAIRAQNSGPTGSSLLHWNGRSWQNIPTPLFAEPLSVADDGHGGAWVSTAGTPNRATYLHWTGGRWATVTGPARSGATSVGGVAHVPGTSTAWSAGGTSNNNATVPFVEHFS